MKLRTTKREIKENSYYIIGVPYCDLQWLLHYESPFSYCCGVYGWACDNYEINTGKHNAIISTGYAYIDDKNVKIKNKYDLFKKYNDKARAIVNGSYNYEQNKKKLTKLLYKLIDEIIDGNE